MHGKYSTNNSNSYFYILTNVEGFVEIPSGGVEGRAGKVAPSFLT